MHLFEEYLSKIVDLSQRKKVEEIINWIEKEFPELGEKIAWNQPMFTQHETFILGMSVSKKHISISPEPAGMIHFTHEIKEAGYEQTKNMFHIPWEMETDFSLLKKVIQYNIIDKADINSFWRT